MDPRDAPLGRLEEAEAAVKESLREARAVGGRSGYVAWALHHLARVAAERSQFGRSARILGYLDRWYEENSDFRPEANEQASYDHAYSLLADSLAAPERARLMADGAAWTEDEAVAEALNV